MKRQEIFNRVYTHLLKQNQASKGSDDRCKYKSDNGLKCAIGCLIPDDIYDPKMEGMSIEFIYDSYPKMKKLNLGREISFLSGLQKIHDDFPVHLWDKQLREFAVRWNVTVPALP